MCHTQQTPPLTAQIETVASLKAEERYPATRRRRERSGAQLFAPFQSRKRATLVRVRDVAVVVSRATTHVTTTTQSHTASRRKAQHNTTVTTICYKLLQA